MHKIITYPSLIVNISHTSPLHRFTQFFFSSLQKESTKETCEKQKNIYN